MIRGGLGIVFFLLILATTLPAIAVCHASSDVDFLLRRLSADGGCPPKALAVPRPGDFYDGGPKPGLGPLLLELHAKDPVFRRAYDRFLAWLDELNDRIHEAGGGRFRQQAIMRGTEEFARAIEALGGVAEVTVRANDLGVTWDSLLRQARLFAAASLEEEDRHLDGAERSYLVNLLALAQIAASANQVVPASYRSQWEGRHPELAELPSDPPAELSPKVWALVRSWLPWMYHSGALPWRENVTPNPHDAYDTYHFFSHAWMTHWDLYRQRYFRRRLFFAKDFVESDLGPMQLRRQLARSDFFGFGYELLTMVEKSGFLDFTPASELPDGPRAFCERFGLAGLPVAEALRDMKVNHRGALLGAAMALTGLPLQASDEDDARLMVGRFLDGSER